MNVTILLVVLAAAFIHAWWNLVVKKSGGGVMFIWLVYVVSIIVYIPMVIWQLASGRVEYSWSLLLFSLASGIVHLAYFTTLQRGYQKADLSVVYPLARGSGPVLSSALGLVLLNEAYCWMTAAGLACIVIGILIITRFKINFFRDRNLKAGVVYGLTTGFFIAAYTIVDAIAVKQYSISPVIITLATNVIGIIGLLPIILKRSAEVQAAWRKQRSSILIVATVSPFAYILILWALQHAPLTAVAPARESSILFGTFLGASVLNEEEGKRRMLASVFILAGIIFLVLS